jgi:hypothetical protein
MHDMVGGKDQQDSFTIAPAGEFGRDRNGGTGIAATGSRMMSALTPDRCS